MTELKKQATNSLKWSAIEKFVTQAIQLIIMLILGRMLGPDAFGLVGMLAIFIAISQTLVDSGFSNALIRKQDRNESDYATTFYFNIIIAIACYLLLYFSAPFIAEFYKRNELIDLTRILGLTVLINGFSIVQRARLMVAMDFKTLAKASLLSVLISAIFALLLAVFNFGVWALVGQSVSFALMTTVLLNIFEPWIPRSKFSIESFKNLFHFGSKLLLSSLISTIYENIYQIIIGRLFSSNQLGLFSQAKMLSSMPAMSITNVIQRVTYPMMSNIQDDKETLEKVYLTILSLSAVIIFPLVIGLALIAKPLIILLLGVEWKGAAGLMSILCIGYMLYPIHAINLNLLQVKGRSDLFLKLEIIKKVLVTIVLIITVPIGIKAICIGMAIQSYIALVINTYYTGKLSSLTMKKQFYMLLPIWIITLLCALISGLWYWVISSYVIQLPLILLTALVLYFISIKYLQPKLYNNVIDSVFRKI